MHDPIQHYYFCLKKSYVHVFFGARVLWLNDTFFYYSKSVRRDK